MNGGNSIERRIVVALAAVGLVASAFRLVVSAQVGFDDTPPSDGLALARDMQLYEVTLMEGSPFSVELYQTVERECQDQSEEPVARQACALFDQGTRHTLALDSIDEAVRLLKAK